MKYRELLAAYQAVRHFRHFVEDKPFTLYTDHKPLTFALSNNADRSPRQFRHLSFIAEFTSDIQHVKGKFNVVADILSRINTITLPRIDFRQLANDQAASQEICSVPNLNNQSFSTRYIVRRRLSALRHVTWKTSSHASKRVDQQSFPSYTLFRSRRTTSYSTGNCRPLCMARPQT